MTTRSLSEDDPTGEEEAPQTWDPVAPNDLRVGDQLICELATGRTILARVKRLERDIGGQLLILPVRATRR